MLFQVEDTHVKLLGSAHASDGETDYPPKWVKNAFDGTHVWIFETDHRTPPNPISFVLQEDRTLAEVPFINDLRDIWTRLQIPGVPDRYKPWYVQFLLASKVNGWNAPGIESIYFDQAHTRGIGIGFLETCEESYDAFDRVSWSEQISQLKATVDNSFTEQSDRSSEDTAWQAGDLVSFCNSFASDREDYPDYYAKVVDGRNKIWLPKLLRFLESNRSTAESSEALITVGASHLCGPESILKLLADTGYRTEYLL